MKGLKKKRKADGQVPPNVSIDASRDSSGAYLDSNPGSYTKNSNSSTDPWSFTQRYTPQSRLALPPQIPPHTPLGSYPGSRQHFHRSLPRHAVERELPPSPPLPPREYRQESRHIRPHSDFIPRNNRTSQYLQGGQDVYGWRGPYVHHIFPSSNSS